MHDHERFIVLLRGAGQYYLFLKSLSLLCLKGGKSKIYSFKLKEEIAKTISDLRRNNLRF